jgi:glycosyltransferase involved in cell wall biosynthesis
MNDVVDFIKGQNLSPRNGWEQANRALDLARGGRLRDASHLLDQLTFHPALCSGKLDIFRRHIDRLAAKAGWCGSVSTPQDYIANPALRAMAPFAHLNAHASVPSPFPPHMALPPLIGVANDCDFIKHAAPILAPHCDGRLTHVHVFLCAVSGDALAQLLVDIADQTYTGRVSVTVFGGVIAPQGVSPRVQLDHIAQPLLSVEGVAHLQACLANDAQGLCVFLDGTVRLDPTAFARAMLYAQVSDALVQPLVQSGSTDLFQTPFSDHLRSDLFAGKYPFRDVHGLNLVVSADLVGRIGLPDSRFEGSHFAAREWGFRMALKGAYLAALHVPVLDARADETGAKNAHDRQLYINLCPNHWDRSEDGIYERPRVSIYIPAYNAARYIQRAVDSVLDQDIDDLEVCICNDGSTDDTLSILENVYGDIAKVRWITRRNSGIGASSNAAIQMSRAPYVGQLDSDDALKPGAVRRLAEYLDENPRTACVYGSCERIDADGAFLKNEYSWPVFSREKMMITSIAHHFRMFRRANWERTRTFRPDIVNGIDYDIFLKLAETGPLHHIDEIMYQRRWHGENTSVLNETHQTTNTHRTQTQTLHRLGMDRFWDLKVPDPDLPRRVTYARKPQTKTVIFWPERDAFGKDRRQFYSPIRETSEVLVGDVDAALLSVDTFDAPENLTFDLHGVDYLFNGLKDIAAARANADEFRTKVQAFVAKGGRLVWTVHTLIGPQEAFLDVCRALCKDIAQLAQTVYIATLQSVDDVMRVFEVPHAKVQIAPQGQAVARFPDLISREHARDALGLGAPDEVLIFGDQGCTDTDLRVIVQAFCDLRSDRPHLKLVIAADIPDDLFETMMADLSQDARDHILWTRRFVGGMEYQVFMRAADVALLPQGDRLTQAAFARILLFDLVAVTPETGPISEMAAQDDRVVPYAQDAPNRLKSAILEALDVARYLRSNQVHTAVSGGQRGQTADLGSRYGYHHVTRS